METRTILLDSTILIEHFRKGNKSKSILFKLSHYYQFCLSIITVFEIKIGLKTDRQKNDYRILVKEMEILPIDELCIENAVKIYHQLKKQNKLIELADLLIAASSISNSLPLLTLNVKHFENIPQIELIPT